jgi:hypothetical protein
VAGKIVGRGDRQQEKLQRRSYDHQAVGFLETAPELSWVRVARRAGLDGTYGRTAGLCPPLACFFGSGGARVYGWGLVRKKRFVGPTPERLSGGNLGNFYRNIGARKNGRRNPFLLYY